MAYTHEELHQMRLDIDTVTSEVSQLTTGIEELGPSLEKMFESFEARLENVEKLHANLAMAYTEMAASVEAVIAELMSPRTDDEKEAFRRDLQARHMATLDMIQRVTREAADKDPEDTLSSTVSDVAEEHANSASDDSGD